MLIEQIIEKMSEIIDISKKFKIDDLVNSLNDNQIDNYLNLLKDNNLLFEENGEYYFEDEVIKQFNDYKNSLESSDESDINSLPFEKSTNLINNENNLSDKPILNKLKKIKDSNEVSESSVKISKNKTLDEFNENSNGSTDFKTKLSSVKQKSDKEPKYWIHKTEFSILEDIHQLKQIGSEKERSMVIKELSPNDYILLIVNNRRHLDFFGLTKVDEVINIEKKDNSDFYKHYKSDIQLKLKSIRYFNNPIVGADIDNELSFVENNKKISAYLKTDYKEIPKEDFKTIMKHGHFIKSFPAYFDNVDLNLKEFIMNSILYLYNNLKNKQKSELIEIKVFLRKLTDFINTLGVKVDYDYIVEFYSWNAIELEFTHVPYRDPDKAIPLYDTKGKKKEYAYIDLK